jgi:hypothetical protein
MIPFPTADATVRAGFTPCARAQAGRGCMRGGNWNNDSNAGVWNLNLNNARSNSNDNVGFRPIRTSVGSPSLTGGGSAHGPDEPRSVHPWRV